MNIKENKNRPIWASVYAILFLLLFILVKINSPIVQGIDNFVRSLVLPITNEHLTVIISILTNLGAPKACLILSCLVIAFVFLKREYATAIWGFGTLIVGNGLAYVFKHLAARPRPAFSERLALADGYSFPSGHTFGTALLALFVVYLIVPRIKNQTAQIVIKVLAVLWVIIIMLSRIYLRVHYPTDTFGSLLLAGAVWEFALMIWLRFFKGKDPVQN
ncbi:phosphatase PAP2 family protein [Ligilactobacillus sp. LYQ135]